MAIALRRSAAATTTQLGEAVSLDFEIAKAFPINDSRFEFSVAAEIPAGITILFGASGAGKSTLLNCIAGLTRPDSGQIRVGNRTLYDSATRANVPVQSRRIGYVFQDLALFPHLTVRQNLEYGIAHQPKASRIELVTRMLDSFRISHLRDSMPREISGGEQQRVALARSLVTSPCILLLDEPLSALDAPTKSKIIDDLRTWNRAHRIPILYVTHNREEVFALGERVLVLENGRLIAQGTPHEVMTAATQETVAQLVGFENIFDARVTSLHPERGTMTCRVAAQSPVDLETPMVRAQVDDALRVGIRAGDILLSSARPIGLSARNLIPGRVRSLAQRDMIVAVFIDCGVLVEVHLTLAARDDLKLHPGNEVWLIVKTHSCHLMSRS